MNHILRKALQQRHVQQEDLQVVPHRPADHSRVHAVHDDPYKNPRWHIRDVGHPELVRRPRREPAPDPAPAAASLSRFVVRHFRRLVTPTRHAASAVRLRTTNWVVSASLSMPISSGASWRCRWRRIVFCENRAIGAVVDRSRMPTISTLDGGCPVPGATPAGRRIVPKLCMQCRTSVFP